MTLRDVVTQSPVSDLPLAQVPIFSPEDRVDQAIEAMRTQRLGTVMVCEDSRLVGIFTERDLLRLMGSGTPLTVLLKGAMRKSPKTVTSTDSLLTVLKLMDEGGCRRLPVLDASGRPLGLIDTSAVVHFLVEQFPTGVYNQTSDRLQTSREREGA
jgi:CBS domain-containing protein